MSARRPRIGLACPRPGERAALIEWCERANFEPVPMMDAGSIVRALDGEAFEALVIDAVLAESGDTPYILRNLGRNRPLLMIGDGDTSAISEAARRVVTYLTRPVARQEFILAVALALAEGRPARRSTRRQVARLPATVEGVPARLIDVSYEGIRLELPEHHRETLPPVFNIRVPMFNADVVGQRVWVNNTIVRPTERAFWCGVHLGRNTQRAAAAWHMLVDQAPSEIAEVRQAG